jgi:large subunit ribosomal protein L9
MKIILKQDVPDLGRSGEVVEVKEGYARNYLLPKQMAVPATPGYIKDLSKRIEAARQREERERDEARAIGDRLRALRVRIEHRAAEGTTRLHGSVTAADIAEAIQKALGTPIDRRAVDLRSPIRTLGDHQVTIKLMRGVAVPIPIAVFDPHQEPEPAPAPEPPAAEPVAAAT